MESNIEITAELLADIKAKAEKAHQGPWSVETGLVGEICIMKKVEGDHSIRQFQLAEMKYLGTREDAEYMAAANPDVVLSLIVEIEKHRSKWIMESRVVFNHTLHMELWNYLAENPCYSDPVLVKRFWLQCHDVEVHSDCFACETAVSLVRNALDYCDDCPLDWGDDDFRCQDDCSLYMSWKIAWNRGDKKEAQRLAIMIADLPLTNEDLYEVI